LEKEGLDNLDDEENDNEINNNNIENKNINKKVIINEKKVKKFNKIY
jgi:hypothetical protein